MVADQEEASPMGGLPPLSLWIGFMVLNFLCTWWNGYNSMTQLPLVFSSGLGTSYCRLMRHPMKRWEENMRLQQGTWPNT